MIFDFHDYGQCTRYSVTLDISQNTQSTVFMGTTFSVESSRGREVEGTLFCCQNFLNVIFSDLQVSASSQTHKKFSVSTMKHFVIKIHDFICFLLVAKIAIDMHIFTSSKCMFITMDTTRYIYKDHGQYLLHTQLKQ